MPISLASVVAFLLQDDFATDPSGPVNTQIWTVPTGAAEFIRAGSSTLTQMNTGGNSD